MAEVRPGLYTIKDLLDLAEVDAYEVASVDYNESGYDLRRVQVGGLPFNDLEENIRVPEGAESVEVTVDSQLVASLTVVNEVVEEEPEE